MSNPFDQFDTANAFDQFDALGEKAADGEKVSPAWAIPTGVNNIVPSVLGLPVDTGTNVANLGIAAYGTLQGLAGNTDKMPKLMGPQMGGSEWIKRKINQGVQAVDPSQADIFANPRPDSQLAEMLHTGSAVTAAALLSPASSVKQAAGNVASMVPSGVGAATMQQLSDDPLAPMAGALLPMARFAIPPGQNTVKPEATASAKEAGYVVPPTQARPSMLNKALEGTAGKISTAQKLSVKNQAVTNRAAAKELGLPEGTEITSKVLQNLRADAGAAYDAARNLGTLKADAAYRAELARIAGKGTAASKEFPVLSDKGIAKLVQGFNKGQMSSEAVVDAVKQLRTSASGNYKSLDPQTKALAGAQKNVADALEGLLQRSAAKSNPEIVPALKAARQVIAKTYTVEKALNDSTGNISAKTLARELAKGRPLSGGLASAGKFGQAFPTAAQEIRSSTPGTSPLDGAVAVGSAAASGNPGFLAMLTGRPLVRGLITSKPYQAAFTKPYSVKSAEDAARAEIGRALAAGLFTNQN